MLRTRLAIILVLDLIVATPLFAQERESPFMSFFDRTGRALVSLFERPVHPVVESVVPGSGVGVGVGVRSWSHEGWGASVRGVASTRSYWSVDASTSYRGPRTRVEAYGRASDLTQLDYFGPTSNSLSEDRANFSLRDRVLGAHASYGMLSWLSLDARVEELWPDVGRGQSSGLPSVEQRFDESNTPGLTAQPRFGRYESGLRFVVPAAVGEGFNQGATYRVTYAYFDDRELDRYSFGRLELEGTHQLALFGALRRLTLHGFLSTTVTSAGQEAPFYLWRTLGGNGARGYVDYRSPGSATPIATLRGFEHYRFADRHALLLQAEYEVPLWGPTTVSIFADAGKVATDRSDLDLTHMRGDAGVGLSLLRGPSTAARLDVGFGSGEGVRVFLTIGRLLVP